MSWEKDLAKEFKKRNNPDRPLWFEGTVLSTDPVSVSCYDGRVLLTAERLSFIRVFSEKVTGQTIETTERIVLEKGDSVALIGDPFSGAAGSQRILVAGVIDNAV